MNTKLIIPVTALAIGALACGPISVNVNVPKLTTGPTETFTVNEPLPDTKSVTDVTLEMGAGELDLAGGAEGLLEGDIKYNVADWKPSLTSTLAGSTSSLLLKQDDTHINGFPDKDVINKWSLKLGDAPMNLTLHAGAYQGDIDLSGVPLRNLTINDGASQSDVRFDTLNPEEMDTFEYDSGASSVTLEGLANANFETLKFNGGAGDYTLDFSGDLQRDATVIVNGGVGSIKIIIPSDTAAKVTVEHGIGSIDTTGTWTISNDVYETGSSGPELTITVKMGVGSLELVSK